MDVRRRLLVVATGCAALAAPLIAFVGPPAYAAPAELVALGDSYASGVGTREYDDASGACQRSSYAYPDVAAARVGASVSSAACSGATTTSVVRDQLATLSATTTHVTVTAGGNDAGFTDVIIACAPPVWASDCDGAIDGAQTFIAGTLPGRLSTLYAAVRERAPGAEVIVVGYPRLFQGEDCNAGTWFSPVEQTRLNATADQLDQALSAASAAYGFTFVDPRGSFTGHAVCDAPEWLNGLSHPVSESYHPNRDGQQAYADLVDDLLA